MFGFTPGADAVGVVRGTGPLGRGWCGLVPNVGFGEPTLGLLRVAGPFGRGD